MTEYIIKTRTPIFTGDINTPKTRSFETVHETGIIGGLRWWYEALLRGAGKLVCDPTQNNICKTGKYICPACKLFGSTNSSRKFSLHINKINDPKETPKVNVKDAPWFLFTGKMGNFSLSINSVRGNNDKEKQLGSLLQLMANWGGIGSKNYTGYGIFDLYDKNGNTVTLKSEDINFLTNPEGNDDSRIDKQKFPKNPSFEYMFFSKITLDFSSILAYNASSDEFSMNKNIEIDSTTSSEVKDSLKHHFLPTSELVRSYFRTFFKNGNLLPSISEINLPTDNGDEELALFRHQVFGERGKSGSKIAISHLYPINKESCLWQMRIWGYIPFPRFYDRSIRVNGFTIIKIINDLKDKFDDISFWQKCFDNSSIKKPPVGSLMIFNRFNKRQDDYQSFVCNLVLNS